MGVLEVHGVLQAHGVSLGLAETLVVACTSTLAAVGAAAIPSAGLVTMLMVLQVWLPSPTSLGQRQPVCCFHICFRQGNQICLDGMDMLSLHAVFRPI